MGSQAHTVGPEGFAVEDWRYETAADPDGDLRMLADTLRASVQAGACVTFILLFSHADAEQYWREKVLPPLRAGDRRVLVARANEKIVGTVQLDIDMPPNQQHRAAVMKLLVHPEARRRGIARALMTAVEDAARDERRTLITLDTRTGDAAESLYVSMGYKLVGVIPNFSRAPESESLEAATFFYKELASKE